MSTQILEEFEQYLHLQKRRSQHTVVAYISVVRRLLEYLSDHALNKLTAQDLKNFLRATQPKIAASSQALWISALKCFLTWCLEKKYIEKTDLPNSLSRPKVPKKITRVVDEEDLPLLLDVLNKRPLEEQLLFELLYGSGLRISEAAQLEYSRIHLSQQKARILGKGKRQREVPLTPKAIQILKTLQNPEKSLVWKKPYRTDELRRWVRKWGELALSKDPQQKLHPHKLRHSLATHLLKRGASLPQIQKLLGHQELATTERYTQINLQDLMREYDKAHPKIK